jgi:hypothetical protein
MATQLSHDMNAAKANGSSRTNRRRGTKSKAGRKARLAKHQGR